MILYPEYMGEPETWRVPKLPAVSERFIKELEGIGTVAGMPRFRIVDGTKATFKYEGDEALPSGTYLQYTAMANVAKQDGWCYEADGEKHLIDRPDRAPDGVLTYPNFTYKDFGMPRYMVEVYRDAREPGVEESGYVWAWTVDLKDRTIIDGEPADISRFRMPSAFDIEHAKHLLRIIELSTTESIKRSAADFNEKRENRQAEQKEIRREERAEATERFIRDELM